MIIRSLMVLLAVLTLIPAHAEYFNVRNLGAQGDGAHLDTPAIQAAVDQCSRAGGGTVLFPSGRYLCGTLVLASHVTLHLEAGAVLLGSTRLEDYPVLPGPVRSYTDNYTDKSLIYAAECEDITIAGSGCLDGQGEAFKGPYKVRPYMIRMISCRDVHIQDVTMRNSPMWVQHYLACDDVFIHGITVMSYVNANNDGIDIDACHRVHISDCSVASGDDAIVLKSTMDRACEEITISNCVLSSACNALKMGTESNGGFRNITISNCTVYDTRLAGLALEMVDGGTMEHIMVHQMVMRNARGGIFVRLGNRARPFSENGPLPPVGSMSDIVLRDIKVTGVDTIGCSISGLPNHPVKDVVLENIDITTKGGAKNQVSTPIPEKETSYPEFKMFGPLPSCGWYGRHVQGLRMENMRLASEKPERRPAIVLDDVRDLDLAAIVVGDSIGGDANIYLQRDVENVWIHHCAPGAQAALVRVGERISRVVLSGNIISACRQPIRYDRGAAKTAVKMRNNL
jgi:polygalacturonase